MLKRVWIKFDCLIWFICLSLTKNYFAVPNKQCNLYNLMIKVVSTLPLLGRRRGLGFSQGWGNRTDMKCMYFRVLTSFPLEYLPFSYPFAMLSSQICLKPQVSLEMYPWLTSLFPINFYSAFHCVFSLGIAIYLDLEYSLVHRAVFPR